MRSWPAPRPRSSRRPAGSDTSARTGARELIEPFRAGFEQGAHAARPDVEIVASVIAPIDDPGDGYGDPARAAQIAEWMFTEENVDVVFSAAGESGRGVIEAATELSQELGRQLWAIGVDTDMLFELPDEQRDHLLTSMVKRIDVAVDTHRRRA